jgi:hypothetical protein
MQFCRLNNIKITDTMKEKNTTVVFWLSYDFGSPLPPPPPPASESHAAVGERRGKTQIRRQQKYSEPLPIISLYGIPLMH